MGIINLCQSAKNYKEKRLAYLALQLVPHDNPTYLKMASNSIKADLDSNSQYRGSVALCALAAVGTPEMLSELSTSVAALIKNKDSLYLRKKALIVALITTKAAPDVAGQFVEPALLAINDQSNSIRLTGCQLATALVNLVDGAHERFAKQIQVFVKLLNDLSK